MRTPYELIRERLGKTMPCAHEGPIEKLGFGDTWARLPASSLTGGNSRR